VRVVCFPHGLGIRGFKIVLTNTNVNRIHK